MSEASDLDRTSTWRRPRNLTSAVYGSVLAASVVVSSGDSHGGFALAAILLVTGFVFWLAHVYAETVASVHGGWRVGAIRDGMAHEWPLMAASIPPAIAAAVAGLFVDLSPADGAWIALIVAVVEQQVWGLAAVRRARLTGRALTRTIALNLVMGGLIVVLKIAIPH
jgi:hypothetical protein